jgi:hypothetical protein
VTLTATLNFIVPLELCAKLNREIVVALATMPPVPVADLGKAQKGTNGATDGPSERDKTLQTPTDAELAERKWRLEWAATIASSELLTSKFTQACMELGSSFASKLAGTMATRANTRENSRAVVLTSPAAATTTTSSQGGESSTAQPVDPYATLAVQPK